MIDICDVISNMEAFHARKAVQLDEIDAAERELDLKFDEDYKKCLTKFGQFSICDHEFTGITKILRLNVVEITKEERLKNPLIPNNLYVLEQIHIDDIVVWQNEDGHIFQSSFNCLPYKIADSLFEYIKLNIL